MSSEFEIILNKYIFNNKSFIGKEKLTSNSPIKFRFLDKKNHPTTNGVYLIFSPDATDFYNNSGTCIYVGEGHVKRRLYSHWYHNRFGSKGSDFVVIFYEVKNQIDRKLLERIFIKHYGPIYNKENFNTDRQKLVKNQGEINRFFRKIVEELKDIFGELTYKDGKKYNEVFDFSEVVIELLQNQHSLEEIHNRISEYHFEYEADSHQAIEDLAEYCGFL